MHEPDIVAVRSHFADLSRLWRLAIIFSWLSEICRSSDSWGPLRALLIVTFAGLTFRTRQEFISDPDKVKEQLLADFARHECKPERDMVNSTLAQIK